MRITKEWLTERGACPSQVRFFARLWPEGGEITRENLERTAQAGLRLSWLRDQLSFPQPALDEYNQVRKVA